MAWRIDGANLTSLQLLAPLRDQLTADGFAVVFECATNDCGGFDFRFGTDVLPEPDMHVDLGDFRFLAAERTGADGPEVVSLIVSRSSNAGYVQMTRVGTVALPPATAAVPDTPPDIAVPQPMPAPQAEALPAAPEDLGGRLESGGAVALDDLVFASGESVLAAGDYASLRALADYLADNPTRTIAIVGHTDASGSLATNIGLSRARARAVRDVLIDRYGAAAGRVQAEGVGYLAPRATNLTEEGRRQNRRVEVMLTSTE
jgi:OOP family OmpA-OmpF porin